MQLSNNTLPRRPRTFLLQPIDLCNLNCKYCYLPGRRDPKRMSEEVLEKTIRLIFEWEAVGDFVRIDWNAGEALTAKIDFFEMAFEMVSRYNKKGIKVEQNIQTNGTLINDDWCRLFDKHDIGVGLSVDGPAFIHDRNRVNWTGLGSHKYVQRGIDCLRKYRPHLSAVCVLTRYSLDFPNEIFSYFRENGFKSIGFNVEEIEGANRDSSFVTDGQFSVGVKEQFLSFMSEIHRLHREFPEVTIREFEQFRNRFFRIHQDQPLLRLCRDSRILDIITVSKVGDLYAFSPEMSGGTKEDPNAFKVGNIHEIGTFSDLLNNQNFRRMASEIFAGVEMCEAQCGYYGVCGGGLPVNKFFENGTFASTETTHCRLQIQALSEFLIEQWA